MRIRITKQPPRSYNSPRMSLRVGRVYNLDSAVASALIAEGCAELDDTLTPEDRRERDLRLRSEIWEAADRKHAPQWMLLKPDVPTDLTEN